MKKIKQKFTELNQETREIILFLGLLATIVAIGITLTGLGILEPNIGPGCTYPCNPSMATPVWPPINW